MPDTAAANEEVIQELTEELKNLWADGSPAPEHEDSRFTIDPPEESDFYNEDDNEEVTVKYMDWGLITTFNLPGLLPDPYRDKIGSIRCNDDPSSTELLPDDQLELICEIMKRIDRHEREHWAGPYTILEHRLEVSSNRCESSTEITLTTDSREQEDTHDVAFMSRSEVDLNPYIDWEEKLDKSEEGGTRKLMRKLQSLRTSDINPIDIDEEHEFWAEAPEWSLYYDEKGAHHFHGYYTKQGLIVNFTVEGRLPDPYHESEGKHKVNDDPRPMELLSDKQIELVADVISILDSHERRNWVGIDQPIHYEPMVWRNSESSTRVAVHCSTNANSDCRCSFITDPIVEWEFLDSVEQAISD